MAAYQKIFIIESILIRNSDNGKIKLIGYEKDIQFNTNREKQLQIEIGDIQPEMLSSKHAYVFKLSGFEIDVRCINIGHFTFSQSGVYQITLSPTHKKEWNGVDVFGIQLAKVIKL